MDIQVFFNPQCSKCRTVRGILDERGLEADYVHYLDETPSREQLESVLELLGEEDPRKMMRTGEKIYKELDLVDADRDALFHAMVEHPILIERPILIRGNRAVIGRPPDKVIALLDD